MTWHDVYILLLVNYDVNDACKLSQMYVHDLLNKILYLRITFDFTEITNITFLE